MTKASTTKLSLHRLQGEKYICQRVEYWNGFAKKRINLYGCIDIVAVHDDLPGVLGVQSTTVGCVSAHVDKCMCECGVALRTWLKAGNRYIIHAWDDNEELTIIPLILKDGLIIRGD